jgi:hypothetical protein
MEFTYYEKDDDECYQQELLFFLNVQEHELFNTIDKIYSSLIFNLSPIYELLKKNKQFQLFTPDYLFLFLFSYDYLYLFGPLLYSIVNHLDYQYHYDKLLEKLNHI